MDLTGEHSQTRYEIRVQGELDAGWQQWFNGLAITLTYGAGQAPTTPLAGPIVDQAALRGLLCRLWDLNLTLISVRRLEATNGKEEEQDE
jgi:hypothetical protein